jgi:hypothetical protein
MKEFNLKTPILEADGKTAISGTKISESLAGLLTHNNEGDALKQWGWIQSLTNKDSISLDDSDLQTLKDIVSKSKLAGNLVKGQILQALTSK